MKNGIFYSVGVGPGDPDLLTVKAIQIIKSCQIIALPESGGKENIALNITKEFINDQKIVFFDMPMTKDKIKQNKYHEMAADEIEKLLKDGKDVAFLTLGDPSIYSTAMYIHTRINNKGFKTIIIPGIPSFCAAAAALDTTLCEGGQMLHIVPASYEHEEDILELTGNKIFMKAGKTMENLKKNLKKSNGFKVSMVERASMKDERIYNNLDEISEKTSYFSIVLVKENGDKE